MSRMIDNFYSNQKACDPPPSPTAAADGQQWSWSLKIYEGRWISPLVPLSNCAWTVPGLCIKSNQCLRIWTRLCFNTRLPKYRAFIKVSLVLMNTCRGDFVESVLLCTYTSSWHKSPVQERCSQRRAPISYPPPPPHFHTLQYSRRGN